jgi:hypothetical protein
MTLTGSEKEYVAKLVAFLRSDHSLDEPPPSRSVSLDDFRIHGGRQGLLRVERDSIADIVEHFFSRKDGKKQGRPPGTMLEKFAASSRLLYYQRLVNFELSDGKSYPKAIKNVARRENLRPSSLKRNLTRFKAEINPYSDEENALSAESLERFTYVCLVQDEINAKKTYDDAVRIVAKRKCIDPAILKRITKSFFEG